MSKTIFTLYKIQRENNLCLEEVRIKSKMGHNECNKQQGKEEKKLKG